MGERKRKFGDDSQYLGCVMVEARWKLGAKVTRKPAMVEETEGSTDVIRGSKGMGGNPMVWNGNH